MGKSKGKEEFLIIAEKIPITTIRIVEDELVMVLKLESIPLLMITSSSKEQCVEEELCYVFPLNFR